MKDKTSKYDLIVIGAGAGGIYAALQAVNCGLKVLLLCRNEADFGGAWLNYGTAFSKILQERATQLHNFSGLVNHKTLREQFSQSIKIARKKEMKIKVDYLNRLQAAGVHLLFAQAQFENQDTIRILPTKELLQAKNFIIATGSHPRPPHFSFETQNDLIQTSDYAFSESSLAEKITIYGGGVVGCEYAAILASFGFDVTILDARRKLLKFLDDDIGLMVKQKLNQLGVKFEMGFDVVKAQKLVGPYKTYILKMLLCDTTATDDLKNKEYTTEKLLYFAGRVPEIKSLNLPRAQIDVDDHNYIKVDPNFCTSQSHIFAIGDVIGPPGLASTAMNQGEFVVGHITQQNMGHKNFQAKITASCIFTIPETAMVGLTETELKQRQLPYDTKVVTDMQFVRSVIEYDENIYLKIIFDKNSSTILGIHYVGPNAHDLVNSFALIVSGDIHQNTFDKINMAHPSNFEVVQAILRFAAARQGLRVAA